MVRLLPLLLLAMACSALEPELITSLASWHWCQRGQNQVNPGVGLSLAEPIGSWKPYVAGLVYQDSHLDQAYIAALGVRHDLLPWLGVDLGAGWVHAHTYVGLAPLPSLDAGTDRWRVQMTILGTKAVGLSMRWKLP